MSAEVLAQYVGANAGDSAFVASCWAEAEALVAAFVGEADIPSAVLDRATLETGSELFHRRQAPNGVMQFQTLDGSAIRVARDPMTPAYPLLVPYVGPGVA